MDANSQKENSQENVGDRVPSPMAVAAFASMGLGANEAKVERIKEKAALLWDEFNDLPVPPGNNTAGRLVAMAKTELEGSVMWAVKAASRAK